jgi:Type IV secretion-system coupling protein DNA-binding domain
MAVRNEHYFGVLGVGFVLSLVLIGVVWHFGVRQLVPAGERFAFPNLFDAWFAAPDSSAYLDRVGRWFLAVGYPYYFTLVVPFGVALFGGSFALAEGRPASVVHALAGSTIGAVLGFMVMILLPRLAPGYADPWWVSLAMPGLAVVFGYLAPRVMTATGYGRFVLRGTVIQHHRPQGRGAVDRAIGRGRAALAGVVLSREAEVRHIAAIGVTGSGKSTVLRGLMQTALARGDRHVVADPDGSALKHFWRSGDAILNPFDARSVKWDMLAEIREETDYRFLGDAALPAPEKGAAHDEWVGYAREIFVACLRTWHKSEFGTSDAFFDTMATASHDELAVLCEGTAAHHYFAKGNERMLGSVMGTMAPRVEIMRQAAAAPGPLFSVRHWIREGRGALWMPYQAHQIAALRELVSCWMGLAITEVLSLTDSATRRIWFHLDELDALGPIARLKDAQTRLRKKGGCVAIGFQSIDQLQAVYGQAIANTIIENCDNKLILRCGASEGGGTAQFASDLIGDREVEHEEPTRSRSHSLHGRHHVRTTTMHLRRRTEKAVLPSQVMQLPDRTGFLKVADRPEWRSVKFAYLDFPEVAKSYVPAQAYPWKAPSPIPVAAKESHASVRPA